MRLFFIERFRKRNKVDCDNVSLRRRERKRVLKEERYKVIREVMEMQNKYRLSIIEDEKEKMRKIRMKEVKSKSIEKCIICLEKKRAETCTFVCSHSFCQPCIVEWYKNCVNKKLKPTCPTCRKEDNIWGIF